MTIILRPKEACNRYDFKLLFFFQKMMVSGFSRSFFDCQSTNLVLHLTAILFVSSGFPYVFPLQPQNILNVAFHAVCTFPLHLLRDVLVDIQGKCGYHMAEKY